AKRHRKVLRD
nr:Chain E, Peptide corresponding to residues 15-24 of histone H4 [synthetic construct]1ZKK_F Chain F, Peptide corresponding to residues 15-24 of histone H4 [synthetic construct]1ZKK_G Chain G, Peptide corresponding to residues 15-24 of histone H4 [synthetic construct]1ZKK_H Chain H, Peptide corresponding to residues 15-24 of histone H4 [synthetic construct]3F9W_E Chain E, Histone H4 [synthetic construct]3F9W_F Chain F, Histone H4 [synthetic construct]3F9W_G Chain G, Histone H4 [synthetic con